MNVCVTLRAFVIATTSIAVAIMLSVIVPIAELRIADEQPTCCCPNPVICKCKGDPSAPSMRVCHSTRTDLARAELPAFTPPIIQVVERTEQPVDVVSAALPSPHPAPAPARPDAPS
jgi:hypothetical protein